MKQIMVKDDVKSWLDSLKQYSRETYNDTLDRLMKEEQTENATEADSNSTENGPPS